MEVFMNEDLEAQDEWKRVGESEISYMLPTNSDNDTLAVQMDISSPLSTLKTILGNRLGADLSHCELWLQDFMQLNNETTLSEQCIQGEGMVQVNLQLKSVENIDRINIIDVLKPQLDEITLGEVVENKEDPIQVPETPHVLEESASATAVVLEKECPASNSAQNIETPVDITSLQTQVQMRTLTANKVPHKLSQNENITRWVMDGNFRKEQEKLKIPLDPINWSQAHVAYWLNWAIRQFNLQSVNASQWACVDGPSLCNMTHSDFTTRIPRNPMSKDPNHDLFWTHLELLRKCKFVGVIQKPVPYLQYITTPLTVKSDVKRPPFRVTPTKRNPLETFTTRPFSTATSGSRTGNNGQCQLWQFLLELLTDRNFRDAISWLGTGGEFKLNNPEMVAQLWGERKNKPHMNYEKLSRALRYYYDGDMICKVSGKRFVYKFVCDLKSLLGYNAEELNKLVTECEQRSKLGRAPSSYV